MTPSIPALIRALSPLPQSATALVVGYSGGLDSTVLLHALRATHPELPLRAVHVCHHLQPQAKAWARACRQQCREWHIGFTCRDITVARDDGRSLEQAAREARYAAVAQDLAAGETLVTAHHGEDQAETFLLQALRGAGVHGLAGMPAHAPLSAGSHWRPWLHIERARIREYADYHGLDWVEDHSNRDPAIDRGYLRTTIWPELTARWPAATRTLARSAAWAAQAATAIDTLAEIDFQAVQTADGALAVTDMAALSQARQAQVVRRWLADAGLDTPDHRHIQQILALGDARLRASPCVAYAHTDVRCFDGCLYAMRALAPVPDGRWPWTGRAALELPGDAGRLWLTGAGSASFDLNVCFRRGGERAETAAGRRTLKNMLREMGSAPWVRDRMPLIYSGNRLIGIADRWRHPQWAALMGGAQSGFVWQHSLPGDRARIVDDRGFG